MLSKNDLWRLAKNLVQFEEVACMRVVSEAKIADFLVNKPGGLHVDILAKQSSLDPDKLARILRVLATKHCFTEGTL